MVNNIVLKTKSKLKKLKEFIGNRDIDFVFIFIILIAFVNIPWWCALMASFGISYYYKKIIKDIYNIKGKK